MMDGSALGNPLFSRGISLMIIAKSADELEPRKIGPNSALRIELFRR
jgi:hypothetical protein